MEREERIVYSDAVNDGVHEFRYLTLPRRIDAVHLKALTENPTEFRSLPLGIKMSHNWAFAYAFDTRTLVFSRAADADSERHGTKSAAAAETRAALLKEVQEGAIERMFPVIRRHKPSEEAPPTRKRKSQHK